MKQDMKIYLILKMVYMKKMELYLISLLILISSIRSHDISFGNLRLILI